VSDMKRAGTRDADPLLHEQSAGSTNPNSECAAQTQAQSTDGRAPASVDSIPLSRIKDGGAQMRAEMHDDTVDDYANDMLAGAVFLPVVVFQDGNDYWLADGFHRVAAARKIGRDMVVAEIRQGAMRDAVLHGIGSNAAHGLRRTQADKRRAVERLLKDPEWARWSDRKLAEVAKVDHKTVGTIRRELAGEFPAAKRTGEIPTEPKPNRKPVDPAVATAELGKPNGLSDVEVPRSQAPGRTDRFVLFDSRRDYFTQMDAYNAWRDGDENGEATA
jgi:hypothetical protein